MLELEKHMRSIYEFYKFDFLDYYENGEWKFKKYTNIAINHSFIWKITGVLVALLDFLLFFLRLMEEAMSQIDMEAISQTDVFAIFFNFGVYLVWLFVAIIAGSNGKVGVHDENGEKKRVDSSLKRFPIIMFVHFILFYRKLKYGNDGLMDYILVGFWSLVISGLIGFLLDYIFLYRTSKDVNSVTTYNDMVNKKKKDFDFFEKLNSISGTSAIKNMGKAIEYYNSKEYEDALAYVRRALECYLYVWMESRNVTFDDEKQLDVFNIIQYIRKKEGRGYHDFSNKLHEIREKCNRGVHANVGGWDIFMPGTAIYDMLDILKSDAHMFISNSERLDILNKQIDIYMNKAKKYAEEENASDAYLNLRKTLECIINGYMHFYHVVCTYGHANNLNGHIDVLCEKHYITEQSQSHMHFIRTLGNKGAHRTDIKEIKDLKPSIKMMEEEIEKYQKTIEQSDNQYYEEFSWDEEKNISEEELNGYDEDEEIDDDFDGDDFDNDCNKNNVFKSYDDCDDEIVETRSKNIFDSDDDEDMTPRDMVHPEEYSDMNHYWDTNRYFDLNKYF